MSIAVIQIKLNYLFKSIVIKKKKKSDREIFLTEAKPVLKSPISPNIVEKSEEAASAG